MTMHVGTRCYTFLLTVLALAVSSDPLSAQRKLTWAQVDETMRLVKLVDDVADGQRPYALGLVDIVPVRDHLFSADDNLSLVFFIYGAAIATNNKPNVSVSYTFFEHTGAAEEVFRATAPQEFNAETLPEQFDLEAIGNQMPVSQAVSLHAFPGGSYRLQIGATDHLTESRIVESVTFMVTPGSDNRN